MLEISGESILSGSSENQSPLLQETPSNREASANSGGRLVQRRLTLRHSRHPRQNITLQLSRSLISIQSEISLLSPDLSHNV